ncbi:MAG: CRISPR-associated protein Cas2 [Verrucomicrobiota bacterium]|jgi:CRISPR-associated protein Cas2|nr:CRISPR-associated protein Cas2 [Verrucomicrobiota bacterium]
MWLFAMFDLPVATKTDRRCYTRFRKALLARGFLMLQFSVYVRPCENRKQADTFMRQIKKILPLSGGQVRVVSITDQQFSDMKIYESKKEIDPETGPDQLLLL